MTVSVRAARLLVLTSISAALLSACVVAPPRTEVVYRNYPADNAPPPDTAVVYGAPPAPLVEVVPVAPFLGAVWVGGFWGWSGSRHVWSPGHYIRAVPGYRWTPHRWETSNGRWALRGGFWVR
jgi:hypothetical protein